MQNNIVLSYLLLSDIHLGHNRNPSTFIISNLDSLFSKHNKKIKNVDVIFITGDIFDRLLSNNSPDYINIYDWLTKLVKYCSDNKIKLRILEGTPSHDWKQAKLLYNIVKRLGIKVDFKYFDNIEVETMTINGYELNILYIPDEIYDNAEDIWLEVNNKLKEKNLDKVDLIMMHGAFKYQLHIKNLDFLHDEERYINITEYLINIGHVHNHSEYDKILCPGSFDRLNFADENDKKGGWLITLYENGEVKKEFLENITAMVFKTIDLTKDKKIDKILKTIPNYSNIRLLVNKEDSIKTLVKELQFKYPNHRFVIKDIDKKEEKELKLNKNRKKELFTFKINKDNIKSLIKEEIGELDKLVEEEIDMLISN